MTRAPPFRAGNRSRNSCRNMKPISSGCEMCAILADYALLEPFTLEASLRESGTMNLGGMHRVDERKLEFLNAAQHKNLIRKGIMGRIYAHLISLENFARLLARKNLAAKPE